MKFTKRLFAALLLLCTFNAFAAEPVAGKDYTLVNPAQPTRGAKIEVLEFFFYGCIHCFHLDPFISAWEKKIPADVEFTYVPAVFNPTWEVSARTYYALEALGLRKQVHEDLFNAWNVNNIQLVDQASNADFLARRGVDARKFGDAYNSFSVQSATTRAKQLGQTYGIRGTPTLIVDGKYAISGLQPAETVRVLNALIEKARAERAAAAKKK